MLRSLQTAKKAMQVQQSRVDVLANNLANSTTAGFRQVLTQVSERVAGGVDNPGADGMSLPAAVRRADSSTSPWPRANDLDVNHATDVRHGSLNSTGRKLDVALASDGFFVVQDQDGGEFFTRDGSFHLDDGGRLVTAGGQQVQGSSGPIAAAGGQVAISEDGTVTVGGAPRGRLRVVDFARPSELQHRGDGLLMAEPDLAPEDVPAIEVQVLQGHLEGSNVDPVRTLVDMIAAQRAFEVHSKMLQANDESLSKSVNTLGVAR